jgi:hypothetical protein
MTTIAHSPSDEMVYRHFKMEEQKQKRGAQARTARFFEKSDTWVANKCRDYDRTHLSKEPATLQYTPPPGAYALLRQMPTLQSAPIALCRTDDNHSQTTVMSSENANGASQSAVGIQLPITEVRYSQQFLVHPTHRCRYPVGKRHLWTIPTCPDCCGEFGFVVTLLLIGIAVWLLFVAATYQVSHNPYVAILLLVVSMPTLRDSSRAIGAWLDGHLSSWRWWTGGIVLTSCSVAALMLYLRLS